MNNSILHIDVQTYIDAHLDADVQQLAMGKSPFAEVSVRELAVQISSKKKARKKLPTWFTSPQIYYPEPLSIEQCSSEKTAAYKAALVKGHVIDLTGGFGVDAYYFSTYAEAVIHCELNQSLSELAEHNARVLGRTNIRFINTDGIAYLAETEQRFDTIYVDPARRSQSGKVFMLKDCSPNVVSHIDLLLAKAVQVIIKTSPLLDIKAGIKELKNVAEVHILSTKNECRELLFVLKKDYAGEITLISTTLNDDVKQFKSPMEDSSQGIIAQQLLNYVYEPDVALLKSGAFSRIGAYYDLEKLHEQTQLYTSSQLNPSFPGRIFEVEEVITAAELKKRKDIQGNVIVRSYPDKAEQLVKKYKIKPSKEQFLIFTLTKHSGLIILVSKIVQYY